MPFQRPRRWTLADLANSSVNTWTGWCRWMPLNGWFFNALASLIYLLMICSYNFGVHQLNSWGAAKCWEKLRSAEGLAWFDTFVSWPNLRFHCRDRRHRRHTKMTLYKFIDGGPLDMIMGSIVISNAIVMFASGSVNTVGKASRYALPTFFYTTLPSPKKASC